jgi:GT2 family glycosyltransferase
MSEKKLQQIYAEHTGRVSDKWSLFLTEYDRLFDVYRYKPVRLLEIGIQNGGSLEIWSKYFSTASALIGCDINPNCANLSFDDSSICVIIGDANAPDVCERVFQRSPYFDIIIDDGSHMSSDIIKSFALYFPRLAEGGLFIAEDLHCSYWSQFEGGLFDPYSSISFFKLLADVINYEHWGIPWARVDILRSIFTKYGCEVDVGTLSQVHSVEFINSMCVVRKAKTADNGLGRRVISGLIEQVLPGHMGLHGQPVLHFDQTNNPYTIPLDVVIQPMGLALWHAQQQIVSLSHTLGEREQHIVSLSHTLAEREQQIASIYQIVKNYEDSTSWWLTKPFRLVAQNVKRIKNFSTYISVLLSSLKKLKNMGLSPKFLGVKIKQWLLTNNLLRKYIKPLGDFICGVTDAWKKNTLNYIHVHVDTPNRMFKLVDNSFTISGWGVNLDASTAAKFRVRIGNVVHQPRLQQREDVQRAYASVCELPLDVGFFVAPSLSMGVHRMWIDVESQHSGWIPVRRALLIRVPRILRWKPKRKLSYKSWNRIEQKRLNAELPEITRHIDLMLHKPIFAVVIDMRQSLVGWENSLQSINEQIYQYYELHALVSAGTKLPSPLEKKVKFHEEISFKDVMGDFITFIECGDVLTKNALYEFANAINHTPEIDLIYGDEDRLSSSGERYDPFYKPDWSPDYLETFNYIGFPACFRTTVARVCFEKAHLYDLALRFTERTSKIYHVAKILGHRVELQIVDKKVLGSTSAQNIASLKGRLSRTGRKGIVREHNLHHGCYEIQLNLKNEPLVSIIIPTAGKTVTVGNRKLDLITNIIDQIKNQSSYKNIEIIVVDNGDLSERQKQILTDQGCERITYTESVFNISKKLNLGASIAKGELLLLLNDDIEILTPSWIERMVEHFEKPHIGVVGAKLIYPNGRIQHAGVVNNHGNPDHVRRHFPRDEKGYYFSTCGVRNYIAVTGAVMMTSLDIYRKVGGYSEELAVSFNDIDYCLKVQENGLWSVYAPQVELIHMESLSRVPFADMSELTWYHKRWAPQLVSEPYYNEQFFSLAPPTFIPNVNLRMV